MNFVGSLRNCGLRNNPDNLVERMVYVVASDVRKMRDGRMGYDIVVVTGNKYYETGRRLVTGIGSLIDDYSEVISDGP